MKVNLEKDQCTFVRFEKSPKLTDSGIQSANSFGKNTQIVLSGSGQNLTTRGKCNGQDRSVEIKQL